MDLGKGAVVTDVAYSFPIVLMADNPDVYTITTDRDFKDRLAAPRAGRVTHALITSPDISPADAIELRYPGIWDDGGGVATLVKEWKDGRGLTWRLYRFDDAA